MKKLVIAGMVEQAARMATNEAKKIKDIFTVSPFRAHSQ